MEEPSVRSWPLPKAHLSGRVSDGTFSCRPRTSAFGGNAVPSVSGQIVPRPDGGTDIVVRVIEWFVFVMGSFGVTVTLVFVFNAASTAEMLKAIALCGWLLVVMAGIYAAEAVFVRNIFARIFS